MIMAGILQVRQSFLDSWKNGDYYNAAWALAISGSLLPQEAKSKFKLENPPSAGKQNSITPDIQLQCRQYVEKHVLEINGQIPLYVYDYFKRGQQIKRGY